MRERFVGERPIRPYRSRKHEIARRLLFNQYGATSAQIEDRTWCYARLAELGYRWDGAESVWVEGKLTGS